MDRSGVADEFVIDSCGTGGGNEDWYIIYVGHILTESIIRLAMSEGYVGGLQVQAKHKRCVGAP